MSSSRTKPGVSMTSFLPLHSVTCTFAPARSADKAMTAPARVKNEVCACGLGMEPELSTYMSRSTGTASLARAGSRPYTRRTVVTPGTGRGDCITDCSQSISSSGSPISHASSPSICGSCDSGAGREGKATRCGKARSR